MAELTETLIAATQFTGGNFKLILVSATIGSASDTIVLTQAQIGCDSILGVVGAVITGGMDADFQTIQVSVSGLTVTVVSKQADGAAADEFTGTTVNIALLGSTSGTN